MVRNWEFKFLKRMTTFSWRIKIALSVRLATYFSVQYWQIYAKNGLNRPRGSPTPRSHHLRNLMLSNCDTKVLLVLYDNQKWYLQNNIKWAFQSKARKCVCHFVSEYSRTNEVKNLEYLVKYLPYNLVIIFICVYYLFFDNSKSKLRTYWWDTLIDPL